MAVCLTWPDGSCTAGESFRAVENALRAEQWSATRSRRAWRIEMRRRAELWSGVRLPRHALTSRAFLEGLAAAGLCIIDESDP